MTTTTVFRTISSLLGLATVSCVGIAQAADSLRYEEIPGHLAPFGSVLSHRGFHIKTIDGKQHNGRRLLLQPDHLRVFHLDKSFEDLPAAQIDRIEITQTARFLHHIRESAMSPLGMGEFACLSSTTPDCLLGYIGMTALFSPVWAYTAATAPFFLAADGIAFLLPPKVYDIVH